MRTGRRTERCALWRRRSASRRPVPRRDRSEDVATCIRYCEANRDRMRYNLCRTVGSGIGESARNCIVGNRLKGAGPHWSKAGANSVLTIRFCFEKMRWPDFLGWRDCSAAAA